MSCVLRDGIAHAEALRLRAQPGLCPDKSWQYFRGYRFGIFNYATQALGGAVTISAFTLDEP